MCSFTKVKHERGTRKTQQKIATYFPRNVDTKIQGCNSTRGNEKYHLLCTNTQNNFVKVAQHLCCIVFKDDFWCLTAEFWWKETTGARTKATVKTRLADFKELRIIA